MYLMHWDMHFQIFIIIIDRYQKIISGSYYNYYNSTFQNPLLKRGHDISYIFMGCNSQWF